LARVIVIDDRETAAELIVKNLRDSAAVEFCMRAPQKEDGFAGHLSGGFATMLKDHDIDTVVYAQFFSSAPARGLRNSCFCRAR
jgi:hypothetical protein